MSSRASLNKVLLIGNLTRDPELRYTPSGAAVCSFTIATNRVYVSGDGNKKEESEFTRVIAWNKLAELCSQLLSKGRKVYVDGRLSTRSWETPDGQQRTQTEVVIDDMRILDSRRSNEGAAPEEETAAILQEPVAVRPPAKMEEVKNDKDVIEEKKSDKGKSKDDDKKEEEELNLDDLPF